MAVEPNYYDLILCHFCGGEGKKETMKSQEPKHFWSPTGYIYDTETCPACEGSGRLELHFYPFKQENL